MITKITNGRLVLKDSVKDNLNLYFKGNKIFKITCDNLPCDTEIDAEGMYVSPGFIDIHTHGGGGFDFMDGGEEPIISACQMHLKCGTTSILPTTLSCSAEVLHGFLRDLKAVMESSSSGCRILGAHLEGPYFSLAQCGAQNPAYIKAPDKNEYTETARLGKGIIKRWSFRGWRTSYF